MPHRGLSCTCAVWNRKVDVSLCTQKEEENQLLNCGSPLRDTLFEDEEDDPDLLLCIEVKLVLSACGFHAGLRLAGLHFSSAAAKFLCTETECEEAAMLRSIVLEHGPELTSRAISEATFQARVSNAEFY